jgi:uncharacterized protein YndB with AHSA1/START domain
MTMTTEPGAHELEVERLIAADPEAVFDGFVEIYDGDERPDWILSSKMDLRTGGEWTVELEPSGMKPFTEVRTIIELDRPKRLAYSMTVVGADSEEPISSEVGLSFVSRSGQTLVKLDQRGFNSKQQAEMFEQTWPHVLTLLAERVEPTQ